MTRTIAAAAPASGSDALGTAAAASSPSQLNDEGGRRPAGRGSLISRADFFLDSSDGHGGCVEKSVSSERGGGAQEPYHRLQVSLPRQEEEPRVGHGVSGRARHMQAVCFMASVDLKRLVSLASCVLVYSFVSLKTTVNFPVAVFVCFIIVIWIFLDMTAYVIIHIMILAEQSRY